MQNTLSQFVIIFLIQIIHNLKKHVFIPLRCAQVRARKFEDRYFCFFINSHSVHKSTNRDIYQSVLSRYTGIFWRPANFQRSRCGLLFLWMLSSRLQDFRNMTRSYWFGKHRIFVGGFKVFGIFVIIYLWGWCGYLSKFCCVGFVSGNINTEVFFFLD